MCELFLPPSQAVLQGLGAGRGDESGVHPADLGWDKPKVSGGLTQKGTGEGRADGGFPRQMDPVPHAVQLCFPGLSPLPFSGGCFMLSSQPPCTPTHFATSFNEQMKPVRRKAP